jgi:hypothetical protein
MLGVDAGLKGKRSLRVFIAMTTSSSEQLPARSPMPLMVALDLPRSGLHGGDGIGDSEAQVVVAVDADDGAIAQSFDDAADHAAVLVGRRDPAVIGEY